MEIDKDKQNLKLIREFIDSCKLLNKHNIEDMTNVDIWDVLGYMALCECATQNQEWDRYKFEVFEIMEKNNCNYYQAMDIHEILHNEQLKEAYDKALEPYTAKTPVSTKPPKHKDPNDCF